MRSSSPERVYDDVDGRDYRSTKRGRGDKCQQKPSGTFCRHPLHRIDLKLEIDERVKRRRPYRLKDHRAEECACHEDTGRRCKSDLTVLADKPQRMSSAARTSGLGSIGCFAGWNPARISWELGSVQTAVTRIARIATATAKSPAVQNGSSAFMVASAEGGLAGP